MANTKVTFLNLLATTLKAVVGITEATRDLATPIDARQRAPYIGVIAGSEEIVSEDASAIRYVLAVDLILNETANAIEEMIDLVKNSIYAPINLGAAVRHTQIVNTGEVSLIEKDIGQARIELEIEYVSTKGAA